MPEVSINEIIQPTSDVDLSQIDDFFTVPQIALKLQKSEQAVYRLIRSGQLPHVRLSQNCIRVTASQIRQFVNQSLEIIE